MTINDICAIQENHMLEFGVVPESIVVSVNEYIELVKELNWLGKFPDILKINNIEIVPEHNKVIVSANQVLSLYLKQNEK